MRILADGYHVQYLSMPVLFHTGMLRPAYGALRPKSLLNHFFQCSTGLNEQTAVNGLV